MRRAAAGLALACVALACASPAGIRRVDARQVHRTLTANVLTTGEPSVPSWQALQRMGLRDLFEDNPVAAVTVMQASQLSDDRVFALAELSFWLGEKTGDRARYLAAAVYAYAFLFPGEAGTPPLPTDPRYRLACDLYNRGLTEGIEQDKLAADTWAGETVQTSLGDIEIAFDRRELTWSGWQLGDFLPAAYFEVRGLRNRYRRSGVGAPLVASLVAPVPGQGAETERAHIPPRLKVPLTALLRIEDARAKLTSGTLRARLELFSEDETVEVDVDGRRVPLEFETSSALAYTLEGPPIWATEIREFLYGGVLPRLTAVPEDQVLFLQPYRPGHIPVVLVHGTVSSASRWAELVNELQSDPRLSQRYQLWLYRYDSGNPIGFSAGIFRDALSATVRALDPERRDPALEQMVVVGHSQGGLLAKLTAVDSGDRFWRTLSEKPFEQLDMEPEERAVIERSLFFAPLPFVKRVVFIATPHGGSYLTLRRVARFVAGLIELPNAFSQLMFDFVARNRDDLLIRESDRPATAIDNMTPDNPFLKTLRTLPVAPGVAAHSIIAVNGSGPAYQGRDGVLKYESAHLDDMVSERVVRATHSCQGHPDTIEEVRRILVEHAGL